MMQKTPIFTTFSAHTKMAADKRGQIEVFARIITITVRKREGTYQLLEDQHPSHQNTIGCLQMILVNFPTIRKFSSTQPSLNDLEFP
jgi:hypothetical protein